MMTYVKKEGEIYLPTPLIKQRAWITNDNIYKEAERNPIRFWENLARSQIVWTKSWKKAYQQKGPFFKWFVGGKLNMCYNAIDRHLANKGEKPALIWVPEPTKEKPIILSYNRLHTEVNKFANVLKSLGVKKGSVVCIYLPLIPEAIISMLACTRIGAIHSVVFSAFSANALKTRLKDGKSKILITADGYFRKGKKENLKVKVDEAIKRTKVKKVVIVKRTKSKLSLKKNEFWYHQIMKEAHLNCPIEEMESNHPLFILYTSGTTGRPKGIIHDTGGYAVQALITTKWNFDLHEDEIIWCTADIGWITGHTYLCYGPLLAGATTLMYEGSPDYPNPGRFWKIINKFKVNSFYTAPTALRMFRLWGERWIPKKMPSLKVLGTVGEPIDPETWKWYYKTIGKKQLPIIDTWWQTETGANVINSFPGVGPFIPGVAGKSFPGIKMGVVDEKGKIKKFGRGLLVQFPPFAPGMLRGVWRNRRKYKKKYFTLNNKRTTFYITGDEAILLKKDYIKILGRSDDVIKVSGHRLSTAEIEGIIEEHPLIGEVAVVSRPDKIKGEAIVVFCRLKTNSFNKNLLKEQIIKLMVKGIGPIAKANEIYFVEDLPKTRSGKIMRRVLKSILRKESIGELSTIVNPKSIKKIKSIIDN